MTAEISKGARVKLKKYEPHSDWVHHNGETAIFDGLSDGGIYPYRILWADGSHSHAELDHLIVLDDPGEYNEI